MTTRSGGRVVSAVVMLLCIAGWLNAADSATVILGDWTSETAWPYQRWLDIANQAYSEEYRSNYSYSQSAVRVDYATKGLGFEGTLRATNLKPNFAYQVQVSGNGYDGIIAERVGLTGRWREDEWNGSAWAGHMLNNKGDGSFPNPNDLLYFERRDIKDKTSPTGLHYLFSGILIFDYFVTDGNGNAEVRIATGSSYHVLWKESQRAWTPNDGPQIMHSFDPDPSVHPAYDMDYGESVAAVFGEWERLSPGGLQLPPGMYSSYIILLEESFHGDGGAYAGNWATVMGGPIDFTIVPKRTLTVQSNPVNQVSITGTPPEAGGTTSYSVQMEKGMLVTLTAPERLPGDPTDYYFQHWELNGKAKGHGRATVTFPMVRDTTAQAVYVQPKLTVTYPSDDGIVLGRGDICVIQWTSEDIPKNSRVRIELCDSRGGSWTLAPAISNVGQWKWSVGKWKAKLGPVYPNAEDYKVRISTLDATATDEGQYEFGIGDTALGYGETRKHER